jgi:DHA2 family multidrug resistance protein-like MFS transporter
MNPTAGRREWLAFAVLALPLLLVSMDVSILYFAVPQISRDLGASPTQQLWIFDVYGFVLAGLLVSTGAIADRIGARRLLLSGAVAFSATSLAAAYSQSAGQLIAARGVLGIAGATLMPSTLSMIRTLFRDEKQRGRAIGAWTGVMTAGVGLGPVVSGILLEHFWWGSVFLVNLPAMALLLVAGPLLLPPGETHRRRFDPVSSVLSLGAVLPAIYGIKEWAAHGWDVRWPACIAVGGALGWLFVRRQRRHPAPMVAPALMANPRYRVALVGNAVCSFALIGNAVLMTAYLQLVLGYGPLEAALWSLVPTVAVGSTAPFAAGLGQRFGMTRVAAAGLAVGALGFGVLGTVGTDSLLLALVGGGVLAAGLVATMSLCGELVLGSLEPSEAGVGAAVSEAASELGGALGIALLGSVAAAGYRADAAAHLPADVASGPAGESLAGAYSAASDAVLDVARAAYVHGMHLAVVAGAIVLVLAAGWMLVGGWRRGAAA